MSSFLNPTEITRSIFETGTAKSGYKAVRLILLGILGGAFIAFASEGSNAAIHTIASVGLGKALAGALFSTGLMMVVLTGGELFTGSALLIVPLLSGSIRLPRLLSNWSMVYIGNFAGSLIVVAFILLSGQLDFSNGLLGAFTLKVAAHKVSLSFVNAFFMGILCNWLVCMAVWMAAAAKDIVGKIFAIFFPIWLFITSGFEHSIANMYYIPVGILAKANPLYVQQAVTLGVSAESLNNLNWGTFVYANLIPVTLGNIIGGALFVGVIFWISFLRQEKQTDNPSY